MNFVEVHINYIVCREKKPLKNYGNSFSWADSPTIYLLSSNTIRSRLLREGLIKKTKKNMDLSIFGWVGGLGKGQNP